jgi:uncharacterized membrane protein
MVSAWEASLGRWTTAGLVDATTAQRIREWERAQPPGGVPNRLAAIAFGFGGLLLMAGIFLFVSAHWDSMTTVARFALLLGMVAIFHIAGACSAERSRLLSTALHATGTAALGAGIYLSGQIFNMAEHWPGALMLWALGAAFALALFRDWPHILWVAVLVPAWLWGEWSEDLPRYSGLWHNGAPAVGIVLLAVAYLSAQTEDGAPVWRRALSRLGAIALLPACVMLGDVRSIGRLGTPVDESLLGSGDLFAWTVAIGLPFAAAFAVRGRRALYLIAVVVWSLITIQFHWGHDPWDLGLYGLYAIGAIGLAAWGVREQRQVIVNLGVLFFAFTTIAFYFSSLMDKLGRSLSLIVGGLLFLVGGWLLERVRRRLIAGIEENRT